jgi:hypothetical protein
MITTSLEYITYKITLGSKKDYRANSITPIILRAA